MVAAINAQGAPILRAEQKALIALDAARRWDVMESGVIAVGGPARELRGSGRGHKAYLGEE
jgi:branched-chain amino acid transport system ATP-binding protein